MGGVGQVACQGFLVRKPWMEMDFFSLESSEMSSSEFLDVCGFGVILGSLNFNAQGCVPALLEN